MMTETATRDRATISVETELMTLKEARKELGVVNTTIHKWAREGRLRTFKVGPHATLTTLADVETLKTERMHTR